MQWFRRKDERPGGIRVCGHKDLSGFGAAILGVQNGQKIVAVLIHLYDKSPLSGYYIAC